MAYSDIAYITTQGVTSSTSLANLADKVNKPGVIAAAATIANIVGAIARADDIIDSYIRGVYDGVLPLVTPPETVRTASAEIAVYLLWQSVGVDEDVNPWTDRFKYWVDFFTKVAKGVIVLDLPSGKTNPASSCNYNREYADREFSPDTMKGRL
jgi:phage gp36-like protein